MSERILIVEDDTLLVKFLRATLAASGYSVEVAADGVVALEALSSRPIDLVLLDLGLPEIDGIDVLRQLRSWAEIPVIVLSARDQQAEKVTALDLASKTELRVTGADDDQDEPDVSAGTPAVVIWTDRRDDDPDVRGARVTLPTGAGAATPAPTTLPEATPTPAPASAPVDPARPALRDARYFWETGFRIDNDDIWNYFQLRGGIQNFGFPTSRTFTFLGFTTQFFQRHVVQLGPDGPRLLNLLDPDLMPYTTINTSTFPPYDPNLVAQAPQVGSPDYDSRIIEFIRRSAPDEYAGQPVRFFETFVGQVDLATAFPNGGGDPALLPGFNLELAGSVTSYPFADPNNGRFIYQRFQRVILHYDAGCVCTQPILLADYFKAILTGRGLPPDLAEQARESRFFGQYDNTATGGLSRPAELPHTNLFFAFEPQ